MFSTNLILSKKNGTAVSEWAGFVGRSSWKGIRVKPTPERQVEEGNHKFASPTVVREALQGLSDADYAKLALIARSFAHKRLRGNIVEPADLLQDAITKTLDGTRGWNTSVSLIKHLDRAMESDSGHGAARRVSRKEVPIPLGGGEPTDRSPDPATRASLRDQIADILDCFADDSAALDVLQLKGNCLSASEIQHELGIGKTQYDTITRRIRRRVAKYITEEV